MNILSDTFDMAEEQGYTIPIFRDSKGETPIDSCLSLENKDMMNKRLAGLLFDKTKDYPLLHSSHTMQRAVCTAIKEKIPEVLDYLKHRLKVSP